MTKSAALSLLGALAASSCLVSIGDVESSGGSGGVDAGTGGSTGGGAGAGATGGSAGTAGNGGSGASGGGAGAGATGGSGGAGGGSGGSAGAAGAGGSSSGCKASLYDAFGDDTIDPALWVPYVSNSSAAVSETGGTLHLQINSGVLATTYAELASATSWDLTGCVASVQLVQPASTGAYAHFVLLVGTQSAEFYLESQELSAQVSDGGGQKVLATTKFEAGATAWWRFREAGGTLNWEVSGDGTAWKGFAQQPLAFEISAAVVKVGSGVTGFVFNSEAEFDELRIGP